MSEVVTNCGELPFNLSSKIRDYTWPNDCDFIDKKDIKEFIRLLKERIGDTGHNRIIDKLAGEELCGE